MARSVFLGIASACIALAVTATLATPSSAMSFSDYDNSSAALGNRADVNELFSGRLTAEQTRKARYAEALEEIRQGRDLSPSFDVNNSQLERQRPLSLTLPF